MIDVCLECKVEFEHKSHAHRKRCDKCGKLIMIGNTRGFIKGQTAWNKGKPAPWARYEFLQTPDARKRMAESKRGKPSPFKGKAGLRGALNPNWKGGTGTERHQAMGRIEYRLWRTAVFMRDDYTCQTCEVRGGSLEADHIKPWSLYPELRYAIDNGRTLCVSCHRQTDTWGARVLGRMVD